MTIGSNRSSRRSRPASRSARNKGTPPVYINQRRSPLPRRTFLKGAGITLALPWLDAMSFGADSLTAAGSIATAETPRRAVFCYFGLGLNGRDFTPAETGLDYKTTPILAPLES